MKIETLKINKTELLINSSDKLGKHMDNVKSGCGSHKSIKDYSRKQKHKQKYDE